MSASRRGFFGFLAGGVATVVAAPHGLLGKVLPPAPVPLATVASYEEFTAITRKAFIPQVYVQIYRSHPLMAAFMADAAQ